jgi:hypothetical protein
MFAHPIQGQPDGDWFQLLIILFLKKNASDIDKISLLSSFY